MAIEQTALDGLNAQHDEVTFNWNMLARTQKDELEAFIRPKLGWEAFVYALPDQPEQKKWKATRYSIGFLEATQYSFNMTMRQVFDI